MITLLTSQAFLTEYRDLITRLYDEHRLQFDPILMSMDGSTTLSAAELARVEVALCSRDIRFHPQGFGCFAALTAVLPNVRWLHFGSAGAGPYPWMAPLRARGVAMTSSVGANSEPVAQTALFGMMYLARRAQRWLANYAGRTWAQQLEPDVPPDLAGQTVMVLGLGNVGTHFSRFAKALRMHVIGVRRSPRRDGDLADQIEPPEKIKQLLPRCDWLVITCPLTKETRGLIDRDAIACMKPTAQIVNVGRGEIADEQALLDALTSGAIAGAHLDVFHEEPLPVDSPLWSLPNVLVTPHNAATSAGNNRRSAEIFITNFVRYARGEPLINAVPE